MASLTMTRLPGAADAAADREDARSAAGGDRRAFERIYRRHSVRIHNLCRRMVGEADADDVAQEAFVRAWRKMDRFRGDSSLGTWLYRLTINVALSRRESIGNYRDRFGGPDADDLHLASRRARPDVRMDLEAGLAKLPDGARRVFVLHDVEGYTHEEIGDLLGITAGTSKSQLHRARMALRQYLE